MRLRQALARRCLLAAAVLLVGAVPVAAQNFSTPNLQNGLTTTVKQIKGTRGALTGWHCNNPNATVVFVQVFDVATAGAVTLGTTVPKAAIGMSANQAFGEQGLNWQFLNGIQVAATTTAVGLTAPGTPLDCSFGAQ